MKRLTFYEAVEYIWENSNEIRDWYQNEHEFDLADYTRSEYRTSGISGPGEVILMVLSDGIDSGIVAEDDEGDYCTVD